jgi:hypothetical protein
MKVSNLEWLEKESPPPAARAILGAMDREFEDRQGALATKSDLQVLKAELQQDLAKMQGALMGEIKDAKLWGLGFWIAQIGLLIGLLKFHG